MVCQLGSVQVENAKDLFKKLGIQMTSAEQKE